LHAPQNPTTRRCVALTDLGTNSTAFSIHLPLYLLEAGHARVLGDQTQHALCMAIRMVRATKTSQFSKTSGRPTVPLLMHAQNLIQGR